MNELNKSLEDSIKSTEIKPDYAKGYLRKSQAERELLLNEDSLKSAEKALELDPESKAVKELYEEWKSEWDDDHTVDEDNPHK